MFDVPRCRLVGAQEVFHATEEPLPAIHGIHAPPQGPYEKILADFPELLVQDYKKSVRHKIRHFIPTRGPPVHARPRRLDAEKLSVAREEFQKMEDLGIVRHSDSKTLAPRLSRD